MTQEKSRFDGPFGEQDRGDATADLEAEVEFMANDTLDSFENEMPNLINRGIGTQKVPVEAEIADWLMGRGAAHVFFVDHPPTHQPPKLERHPLA